MARNRRTPEERERRAKMTSFLQDLNVSSIADVQELFKELIGNVLENGLEQINFEIFRRRCREFAPCRGLGRSPKVLKANML